MPTADPSKPTAEPTDVLAPRTYRLIAFAIDVVLAALPATVFAFGLVATTGAAVAAFGESWRAQVVAYLSGGLGVVLVVVGGLGTTVLTFWQLAKLALESRTIGGDVIGIIIVGPDGTRAGFMRAVVVRMWIFGIPFFLVGALVESTLGDALAFWVWLLFTAIIVAPVLGRERKALYDRFARTRVMKATDAYRPGPVLKVSAFATVAAGGIGLTSLLFPGLITAWFHYLTTPRDPEPATAAASTFAEPHDDPPAVDPPVVDPPVAGAPAPAETPRADPGLRSTGRIDVAALPSPRDDEDPRNPPERARPELRATETGRAPVSGDLPRATLYRFLDDDGSVHIVDDVAKVPAKHRADAVGFEP